MQQGTVKWFDDNKGYGFITGDDRKDYFVHRKGIKTKPCRFLEKDQRVSFDVEVTEKGEMAIDIIIE